MTDELIVMAQIKHLRPILTKDLYNALVADTVTYADLLDVVLEPLAWFVYYELMLIYYVSITEQGMKFTSAQYTSNISNFDFEKLKAWGYQSAMAYYSDITEHLSDNNYPLFESGKKLKTKIIGGMIL